MPDGQPLVWAHERAGPRPLQPRLRPRPHGALLRARRADRRAHVPLRRAQPGRARAARAQPAHALPRAATSSAATRRPSAPLTGEEEDFVLDEINRSQADVVWVGHRRAQAGEVDGGDARPPARRPCSSAWAPRSTSTPGSSPRRRAGCSRSGLEWAYRLLPGAAAPVAALPALQPALRRRVPAPVAGAPPYASPMSYDVAVIGCGRVGLPLALAFADHGLRTLGVENDPERLAAVRDAADALPGAGRRRGHAARTDDRLVRARRRRGAGRRDRPHARHAVVLAHRDRHARHPLGARRPAAGAAPGPPARAALDDRAAAPPSSSRATSSSTST